MLGDNDQATLLSQQDMVTNGNKFNLLDYHYGKEQVKEGHTSTRRVDTKSNYSDMFTKAVPKADLDRLGEVVKGNQGLHQDTPPKSPEWLGAVRITLLINRKRANPHRGCTLSLYLSSLTSSNTVPYRFIVRIGGAYCGGELWDDNKQQTWHVNHESDIVKNIIRTNTCNE